MFQRLSNINFCSCRGHDVQHWGLEHVIKRFQADVNKDLPYLKALPRAWVPPMALMKPG